MCVCVHDVVDGSSCDDVSGAQTRPQHTERGLHLGGGQSFISGEKPSTYPGYVCPPRGVVSSIYRALAVVDFFRGELARSPPVRGQVGGAARHGHAHSLDA